MARNCNFFIPEIHLKTFIDSCGSVFPPNNSPWHHPFIRPIFFGSAKTDIFERRFVVEIRSFNESEILNALRVLLPSEISDYREVLESVQLSEIRSAYRERVMKTHPDKVPYFYHESWKRCPKEFLEVKNAYEILNNYLKSKIKRLRVEKQEQESRLYAKRDRQFVPGAPCEIGFQAFVKRSFRQAGVPQRYLRFGEFLYYSGLIPWQALTRALIWQRRHRPLKQKEYQMPIGKYFLRQRLLSERRIQDVLVLQRMHNLRYGLTAGRPG